MHSPFSLSWVLMVSILSFLLFSFQWLKPTALINSADSEVVKLMSFQELKSTLLEVTVTEADLPSISSGVVQAERWLESHVLIHSPTAKISKIIVGRGVLCSKRSEPVWFSVLPCVQNLHYTLAKWEMLKQTELAVALSSDCFDDDELKEMLKPLLSFLQDCNLTCFIEQASHSQLSVMGMKGAEGIPCLDGSFIFS